MSAEIDFKFALIYIHFQKCWIWNIVCYAKINIFSSNGTIFSGGTRKSLIHFLYINIPLFPYHQFSCNVILILQVSKRKTLGFENRPHFFHVFWDVKAEFGKKLSTVSIFRYHVIKKVSEAFIILPFSTAELLYFLYDYVQSFKKIPRNK